MLNELMFSHGFDKFFNYENNFNVDISQSDTGIELRAEVPGVSKENIQVSFCNGILSLKVIKKNEIKEQNKKIFYREINYGEFERKFKLENLDEESIHVTLKDGLLLIKANKQEKHKTKLISIE